MAHHLAMDKVHAINNLAAAGHSARRIARMLGISRKAVARHLATNTSKVATAHSGSEASETPSEAASEVDPVLCTTERVVSVNRTIQFVAADGKQRSIRLGKVTKKAALSVKVQVEALNAAKMLGQAPQ